MLKRLFAPYISVQSTHDADFNSYNRNLHGKAQHSSPGISPQIRAHGPSQQPIKSSINLSKIGQFLAVNFFLEDTTTSSGMGNELRIQLPKGMKAAATTYTGPLIVKGTVDTEGYITTGGTDKLYCYRTDHSAWPSSITDNLDVRGDDYLSRNRVIYS